MEDLGEGEHAVANGADKTKRQKDEKKGRKKQSKASTVSESSAEETREELKTSEDDKNEHTEQRDKKKKKTKPKEPPGDDKEEGGNENDGEKGEHDTAGKNRKKKTNASNPEQDENEKEQEKEKEKETDSEEEEEGDEDSDEEVKEDEDRKDKKKKKKGKKPSVGSALVQRLTKKESFNNFQFYSNELMSTPSGGYIDNLHRQWFYNYDLLEAHHGYVQWFFPVFESGGMNTRSFHLGKEEAKTIRESFECACRFLRTYRLMLNFYGFKLVDLKSGHIERHSDWHDRFINLDLHSHNNLRISRIIMCLGELGFGCYKKPLVSQLEKEIEKGKLIGCKQSLYDFWKPLAFEEDTPAYKKKTKEEPEDRSASVFFEVMAQGESASDGGEYCEKWKEYLREEEKYLIELKKWKKQFDEKMLKWKEENLVRWERLKKSRKEMEKYAAKRAKMLKAKAKQKKKEEAKKEKKQKQK